MAKHQTFGQRLKQLREAARLSQAELAEKAGLHQFGVAKLEQGARDPSWDTVQKLAAALGVTCSAFEGTAPNKQEGAGEAGKTRPGPGRPRKQPPVEGAAPLEAAMRRGKHK
jgi:transcriptional regulator with XRE-family HTH domain